MAQTKKEKQLANAKRRIRRVRAGKTPEVVVGIPRCRVLITWNADAMVRNHKQGFKCNTEAKAKKSISKLNQKNISRAVFYDKVGKEINLLEVVTLPIE